MDTPCVYVFVTVVTTLGGAFVAWTEHPDNPRVTAWSATLALLSPLWPLFALYALLRGVYALFSWGPRYLLRERRREREARIEREYREAVEELNGTERGR